MCFELSLKARAYLEMLSPKEQEIAREQVFHRLFDTRQARSSKEMNEIFILQAKILLEEDLTPAERSLKARLDKPTLWSFLKGVL